MAFTIFSGISPEVIILGLLFVIFFALIQLFLSRSLKDRNSASVIAFCVSLLSVYGISRTGFNVSSLFYNLGININTNTIQGIMYSLLPILIIAGLVFIFWKVKARVIFVLIGLILMVASRFVYEKTIVLVLGIIFLLIGIVLIYKESRRKVKHGIYLRR